MIRQYHTRCIPCLALAVALLGCTATASAEPAMTNAAEVGGLEPLDFGKPAEPVPPGRDSYGTPGGYRRGYEGSSPSDLWNRDADYRTRDYQLKHSPAPSEARAPSGVRSTPGGSQPGLPGTLLQK